MDYPSTPVRAVAEEIHGKTIVDNYRWLESNDDPDVHAWSSAQNELTEKMISPKLRKKLATELAQNFGFTAVDLPSHDGQFYFWTERKPGVDQSILYVKEGLDGKKRPLIDPNKISTKDRTVTLDFWQPSSNGHLLSYGMSEAGNELSVLSVLDVTSGEDLEMIARNASYASMEWLPDDSGFYYTKHPDPGTVPEGEERLHHRAYFHKLGQDSKDDKLIFGEGRHKEDSIDLRLSPDGKLLFISVTRDWLKEEVFIYETATGRVRELIVGLEGQFSAVPLTDKVLMWTNYLSPNGRILAASIDNIPQDLAQWEVFIPESEHKLEGFFVTEDKILVSYLIDAAYRCQIYDHQGKQHGELPMPAHSSILRYSAHRQHKEFFYEYASFVTPGTSHRYNPENESYGPYYQMTAVMDPTAYEVKQEWFESADGTRVPMFIVHKRGLEPDGSNPAILYGYGGFESSTTPWYLRSYEPWLRRGGIMAIANIRGGGEFGKKWHLDGIKDKKQNSYDDFIGAAQHLVSAGYSSPERLGILGGSNGGLLVSAVAMQKPELFGAVVSQVPLTDMVRFPDFLIAGRWTSEYGDPKVKNDFERILKFSPYHNVRQGQSYPAFLFTTADQDTRVHPLHARKMAAQLQSLAGGRPVLLYTERETGHVGSLTMSRFYDDMARVLTFFAQELSLPV
jgi:prolyl oligopeptidase